MRTYCRRSRWSHVQGNEPRMLHNVSNIHHRCFYKHDDNAHGRRNNQNRIVPVLPKHTRTWLLKIWTQTTCTLHHFPVQGLCIPIKADNPVLPTARFGRSALGVCFLSWAAWRWGKAQRSWKTGAKNIKITERDLYQLHSGMKKSFMLEYNMYRVWLGVESNIRQPGT